MQQDFLENNLIILTKQTLDIFLKQENPSELISLYTFYYYTAKWQETNQPKCTTDYVAQGLHWNRHKVVKVKKQLLEFGLIEDVRIVDQETKRVKGYYIKINYILKKDTVSKIQCAQNPPSGNGAKNNPRPSVPKIDRVDSRHTNALSAGNLNASSADNYYSTSCQKEKNKIGTEKEKNKEANKVSDILGESRIHKWITHMWESDYKKIITLIDSYINKYSYQGNDAKRLIQTMGDMVDMRIKNDEEGKGTYCMTAYGMQVILDTLDKVCPSGDISYKIECLNQAIDDRSDNVRPIKRSNKKGFSYSDNIHHSNNKYSKYEDGYDIYAVIGQKYKPNNED